MTEAERKLWQLLRSRRLAHVKFRRQAPLGPWIADFVTYEHKVIVEADGSQHAESERDKNRDLDLAARGFRVLRFWNNDILARPQAVIEQILDAVR
jgi:very-short-patch-repair endonuclease